MAIKAHLDPMATGDGQRQSARRDLRLETSGQAPGGGEANVTVHNISAAGLLIETALQLNVGDELALHLPQAGVVAAVIVWRSERLYGCAFARALGPAALAAAHLQGTALAAAHLQGTALADTAIGKGINNTGEGRGDTLGIRLNRLRREAGLTLADVAGVLGVSKPTVWAWEKGKARPLPERIGAIAAALGVADEALAETLAAAPLVTGSNDPVIEECRARIAQACGTSAAAVRIMIEM